MAGIDPTSRSTTLLSLGLAGLLVASMAALGTLTGPASGQTTIQDDDCTFSVTAADKGKNWWQLSASCEFSGWDFIDMQGFGLRGSEPAAVPPECKKYADQTFPGNQQLQSHVCGPAGLEATSEGHQYLSGAVKVKVNPKAAVPEGYNARVLWVELYYSSHPGLHGAGGLAAEVEIKVPKKWIEPSPSPSPTETPEPTPSEPVPTASPSPTPTSGPVLVLTKTAEPKKVPESGGEGVVTWTVTVRNVGNAAYEGHLSINDHLPDIWNLIPEEARAEGAMGFSAIGVFYRQSDEATVEAGPHKGDPGAAVSRKKVAASDCMIRFQAGKTLSGFLDESYPDTSTTVDDWTGHSFTTIFSSKRAEKLHGSAVILCGADGRLEPGEEVIVTITARRYGRDGDIKENLASAFWNTGNASVKTVTELEGINSVIEDIENVVPLGRPSARPMGVGPGEAFYGTEEADELTGTSRSDVLMGHYGNDVLRGLAGIDVISGGVGNDEILGGGGGDGLIGGSGKDVIYGDDGNDVLVGGPDTDRLFGGAGDDRIYVRDGERDIVECGPGEDVAIVDKKDKVTGCEKVRRK